MNIFVHDLIRKVTEMERKRFNQKLRFSVHLGLSFKLLNVQGDTVPITKEKSRSELPGQLVTLILKNL